MTTPGPIIVTGVPLSGASVVAEALYEAGCHLGDFMSPPDVNDPAGYFTDDRIAGAHEAWLAERGGHFLDLEFLASLGDVDALEEAKPGARFLDARTRSNEALVAHRGRGPWGWKDARTVFFLSSWSRLLPDAKWVFVSRPPELVAWSVSSRPEFESLAPTPWHRARLAVRLWEVYQRRVLAFVHRHREQSILLRAPVDFADTGSRGFERVVRDRWGIALPNRLDLAAAYRHHYIRKRAPRWVCTLVSRRQSALSIEVDDEAERLWKVPRVLFPSYSIPAASPARNPEEEDLRAHPAPRAKHDPATNVDVVAGISRNAESRTARVPPVIAIALRTRFEYTQTFVCDHLHGLPATVRMVYGANIPTRGDDGISILSWLERSADAMAQSFHFDGRRFRRGALARHLRREGVRAVLAEFGTTGAEVAEACAQAKVPLIVHFHGFDAYAQSWLQRFRESYAQMFEIAHAIVAVSPDMLEQLVRIGAPREKIQCNPCGVDTTYFRPTDPAMAPPHVLSTGRFVDKKAPHLTLLAFRGVLDRVPDARLLMFGDGPLLASAGLLTKALGMTANVEFWGPRTRAEVCRAMGRVRAFVQHSVIAPGGDSEGTPVSILEAGASGLPVVSTRHAGIKDVIVDGETGFLCNEGDVAGTTAALVALLEDPVLAARVGGAARDRVTSEYSMEKSLGRLWKIVRGAIGE